MENIKPVFGEVKTKDKNEMNLIHKISKKFKELSDDIPADKMDLDKIANILIYAVTEEYKKIEPYFVNAIITYDYVLYKQLNINQIIKDSIIFLDVISSTLKLKKDSPKWNWCKNCFDTIFGCIKQGLQQAEQQNKDITDLMTLAGLIKSISEKVLQMKDVPDQVYASLSHGFLYTNQEQLKQGKFNAEPLIYIILYWFLFYREITGKNKKQKTGIEINGKDISELSDDSIEIDGDTMTVKG